MSDEHGSRPKSIILFNRYNLAATLIGIVNIVLHYGQLRNLAITGGSSPASPMIGIILPLSSYFLFWFLIYRQGYKIAKWVFIASTAIAIAMLPINFGKLLAIGQIYTVIGSIAFLCEIVATAMLFRADAARWFERA